MAARYENALTRCIAVLPRYAHRGSHASHQRGAGKKQNETLAHFSMRASQKNACIRFTAQPGLCRPRPFSFVEAPRARRTASSSRNDALKGLTSKRKAGPLVKHSAAQGRLIFRASNDCDAKGATLGIPRWNRRDSEYSVIQRTVVANHVV